jgi:hypothetical protein
MFHEKMKNTMLKKYGVKYPLQNKEIADKSFKICYKSKLFIFPSGKEINCQGYEPFALKDLIINEKIDESDIITGCRNVPEIIYLDEKNKTHIFYN